MATNEFKVLMERRAKSLQDEAMDKLAEVRSLVRRMKDDGELSDEGRRIYGLWLQQLSSGMHFIDSGFDE